jgi:hypothetical protein
MVDNPSSSKNNLTKNAHNEAYITVISFVPYLEWGFALVIDNKSVATVRGG